MLPWIKALAGISTPAYLIDQSALAQNIARLSEVKTATSCQLLLALKGYATHSTFSTFTDCIDGATASSIYEARLAKDTLNGECHVHAVAMHPDECASYNRLADHISFNSFNQWQQFLTMVNQPTPSIGLRINPGLGYAPAEKYNPCAPFSRLGIPMHQINPSQLADIDGLHFHALCEETTTPLAAILNHIESYFGDHLHQLKWMNWGGGHLISSDHYQRNALIDLINRWQQTYNLRVILEPGEAFGRQAGYYVATILDIVHNEQPIIITDLSITAHMPDVLEFPYLPDIVGVTHDLVHSHQQQQPDTHTYFVGGNTCLAGDMIGPYYFDQPLSIGDSLIFLDMGHYTIVKTSNFNGVKQPMIGMIKSDQTIQTVRQSCYFNYKERLS